MVEIFLHCAWSPCVPPSAPILCWCWAWLPDPPQAVWDWQPGEWILRGQQASISLGKGMRQVENRTVSKTVLPSTRDKLLVVQWPADTHRRWNPEYPPLHSCCWVSQMISFLQPCYRPLIIHHCRQLPTLPLCKTHCGVQISYKSAIPIQWLAALVGTNGTTCCESVEDQDPSLKCNAWKKSNKYKRQQQHDQNRRSINHAVEWSAVIHLLCWVLLPCGQSDSTAEKKCNTPEINTRPELTQCYSFCVNIFLLEIQQKPMAYKSSQHQYKVNGCD